MSKGNIIIAGGTGLIGTELSSHLAKQGYTVKILSRSANTSLNQIQWNGKTAGPWVEQLEGAEAVINLSGKSINTRLTKKNKDQIICSRVDSTKLIAEAIAGLKNPPKTWINASAIGYYGNRGNEVLTELSSSGTGFIAEVCIAWEKELFKLELPDTRRVAMRIGVVLSAEGGAFKVLKLLSKFGLGGQAGNGKQYISWIHIQDIIKVFSMVLESPSIIGPVNACTPYPVQNSEFMRTIRTVVKAPIGIPQPAPFIKLGSFIIDASPELILEGQRVEPSKLMYHQFPYAFPDLKEAVKDLV